MSTFVLSEKQSFGAEQASKEIPQKRQTQPHQLLRIAVRTLVDLSTEIIHGTASQKRITDIACLTPELGWKEGMKAAQHVYTVKYHRSIETFQEVWSF